MKNKKELDEIMVSPNVDSEDVEREIEGLKTEIERMLIELTEISPDEMEIIEKIKKVLDEQGLKYLCGEDGPKHIELRFGMDNKLFKLHVNLQNRKVLFRLSFPFRVQANAYPLMCMYMAELNKTKAFSIFNIDADDGELTIEYCYMLEDPAQFNDKYFLTYMTSIIEAARATYTKVAHLAAGMVPRADRKLYKKLLEMALETLAEDFEDDNVCYGIESLRSELHSDQPQVFENEDGSGGTEIELDEENRVLEYLSDIKARKDTLSFEPVLSTKDQSNEGQGEESKKQIMEPVSVFSMFAKKDEDEEVMPVGGIEDE